MCVTHCVLDIAYCYFIHIEHKYDNFIVGLTNISPNISTPTLYDYALCGQYPVAVPNGTTVSLYCPYNIPPFRFVILQRPLGGFLVACEIEVLVRGTIMSNINILIFTTKTDSCSIMLFIPHVEERLAIALHDLLHY